MTEDPWSDRGSEHEITVLDVIRWGAYGFGALIALAVAGGGVVGLLAVRSWESIGAGVLAGIPIWIYDMLLITPLAVGPAVAVAVGIPAVRLLDTNRIRPRIAMSTAGVVGSAVAAVFWFIGAGVAVTVSIRAAQWGSEASDEALTHYLWSLAHFETVAWSLGQSVVLAVAVLVVPIAVAARNDGAGQRRMRPLITGTAAVTVLFGALFAVHAVRTYHDLSIRIAG